LSILLVIVLKPQLSKTAGCSLLYAERLHTAQRFFV